MTYQGVIKGISYETGYGFIDCPQTQAIYGKDIFFLKTSLPTGYCGQKNDPVSFNLTQSEKGPTATAIQMLSETPTFIGEIKSFNPSKGWGMIACDPTQKMYGKDIFFLKTSCVEGYTANAGDQVQFTVEESEKGPQAKNIRTVKRIGKGGGQPGQGALLAQLQTIQRTLGLPVTNLGNAMAGGGAGKLQGKVKSFNEAKGWGMIDCPRTKQIYGKDMFFLKTSLVFGTVSVGDSVEFVVRQGAKGAEAADISAGTASLRSPVVMTSPVMASPTMPTGSMFAGSIKSYNEEKGWGFIASDQARAYYGKDMFLHKNELNGYTPSAGEQVVFSVGLGGNGQPQATSVSFTSGLAHGISRSSPY